MSLCILVQACQPIEAAGPTATSRFVYVTAPPVAAAQPTLTSAPQATFTMTPTRIPTETLAPTVTPAPTEVTCQETTGKVERFEPAADDALSPPLPFRMYTPPCYGFEEGVMYPVLYIFHGQSFNDDQWDRLGLDEAADRLIASGEIPPFLMVMPLEADTWANPFDTRYGFQVVENLIPWVDQNYPTCAERRCRAVGGLSRGGAWAIHVGFTFWNIFGSIGAHSTPPFGGDTNRLPLWVREIPPEELPRMYMDMGENDYWGRFTVEFEAMLTAVDVPHEWIIFEGTHDEAYWSSHVEDYLRWYAEPWKE